jgi:hypothetical protein
MLPLALAEAHGPQAAILDNPVRETNLSIPKEPSPPGAPIRCRVVRPIAGGDARGLTGFRESGTLGIRASCGAEILDNPVREYEPVDSERTTNTVRNGPPEPQFWTVLESLILAQDERWQCALDMQVERSTVNLRGIGD